MKNISKLFAGIMAGLVLCLSILPVSMVRAQATSIPVSACPVGYVCKPIPPQPTGCPSGYICESVPTTPTPTPTPTPIPVQDWSISVVGQPTLNLEYSFFKESLLTASFDVAINGGTNGVQIYKNNAAINFFNQTAGLNIVGNSNKVMPLVAISANVQTGSDAYGQQYFVVPAGQTLKFRAIATANPQQMFAGVYNANLNSLLGLPINSTGKETSIIPVSGKKTNSKTIIGERSPYISGVTSRATIGQMMTVIGQRLNDVTILIDGKPQTNLNDLKVKVNREGTMLTFILPGVQFDINSKNYHSLSLQHKTTGMSNLVGFEATGYPFITKLGTDSALPGEKVAMYISYLPKHSSYKYYVGFNNKTTDTSVPAKISSDGTYLGFTVPVLSPGVYQVSAGAYGDFATTNYLPFTIGVAPVTSAINLESVPNNANTPNSFDYIVTSKGSAFNKVIFRAECNDNEVTINAKGGMLCNENNEIGFGLGTQYSYPIAWSSKDGKNHTVGVTVTAYVDGGIVGSDKDVQNVFPSTTTVDTGKPVLTSISPTSGANLSTLNIYGSNFLSMYTIIVIKSNPNGSSVNVSPNSIAADGKSMSVIISPDYPAGSYDISVANLVGSTWAASDNHATFTVASPTTPNSVVTASASLSSANTDVISGSFAPGANSNGRVFSDWHWTVNLQGSNFGANETKRIKSMTLYHAVSGEGWSTSGSPNNDLGKGLYPLLVVGKGYQNTAYDEEIGLAVLSQTNPNFSFDIWGQPESTAFRGGRLVIKFTDGTFITAQIPSSTITPSTFTSTTPGTSAVWNSIRTLFGL